MRSNSLLVLAGRHAGLLALVGLAAWARGSALPVHPARQDPSEGEPVLSIDGQDISGAEYGRWLLRFLGEKLAREYALEYFVVDRESRRLDLEVTDEEVAAHVDRQLAERIAGAFLGSKAEWLKELDRTGRTEGSILRQRRIEEKPLLESKAIAALNRVVPQEKIEREWWLRYGRNGRQYDVQMIKFKVVVETLRGMSRDEWRAEDKRRKDEQLAKALGVRAEISAGADFGDLARKHSTDPDTRDHRGVPSAGFSHVGWPHTFMMALEKLKPGDLSEPLYARGGYWLVKVNGVKETPLEGVRNALVADLIARGPDPDEVGAVQERLREGVSVKILPGLFADEQGGELPGAFEHAIDIDGDIVRRGEYAGWILHTRGEVYASHFVEEWLLHRKALEMGVSASDEEVAQRSREYVQFMIDSGYKKSRESWLAFLTLNGRTEESYLRDILFRMRSDLLAEKMILRERKVTSDEVKRRFKYDYSDDGLRIEARTLVVPIRVDSPDPSWSREELQKHMDEASATAKARAFELARRIRKGEDFATLARQYSGDEETRERGGALKDRFRPGTWPAEIAEAVTRLKEGEITDPFLQGGGWVLFQVTRVRHVAFEEVAKELEKEILEERPDQTQITAFRNTLRKTVKSELRPGMYK